jgi:hypothetical protein
MTQSTFTAALLDPALPPPAGLQDADGRPAGRRYDVYRNNVAASLTEALRQAFPVIERLLGSEYFTALANMFWHAHPPTSRRMMLYGAEMPRFLATFPPLAHLPYLPDVAKLEQALRIAYHAADAAPIAADRLGGLAPDTFLAAKLTFAPAVQLITSGHPILSIWQANTKTDAPPLAAGPQSVLILRPQLDPAPHLLPDAATTFLNLLMAGATVGDAMEIAGPDLDLNFSLSLLIGGGAITHLT